MITQFSLDRKLYYFCCCYSIQIISFIKTPLIYFHCLQNYPPSHHSRKALEPCPMAPSGWGCIHCPLVEGQCWGGGKRHLLWEKVFVLWVLPGGEPHLNTHEEDISPGLSLLGNLTCGPKENKFLPIPVLCPAFWWSGIHVPILITWYLFLFSPVTCYMVYLGIQARVMLQDVSLKQLLSYGHLCHNGMVRGQSAGLSVHTVPLHLQTYEKFFWESSLGFIVYAWWCQVKAYDDAYSPKILHFPASLAVQSRTYD